MGVDGEGLPAVEFFIDERTGVPGHEAEGVSAEVEGVVAGGGFGEVEAVAKGAEGVGVVELAREGFVGLVVDRGDEGGPRHAT